MSLQYSLLQAIKSCYICDLNLVLKRKQTLASTIWCWFSNLYHTKIMVIEASIELRKKILETGQNIIRLSTWKVINKVIAISKLQLNIVKKLGSVLTSLAMLPLGSKETIHEDCVEPAPLFTGITGLPLISQFSRRAGPLPILREVIPAQRDMAPSLTTDIEWHETRRFDSAPHLRS